MPDPVSPADATLDDVEALLRALVAIDSVNPDLDPTRPGEGEIAAFVAAWGKARGLEVTLVEARPGRPAVLLRAVGAGARAEDADGRAEDADGHAEVAGGHAVGAGGPRRTLLLNAHLDTVGVHGMDAPFQPRRVGDRLYARGAMDMKASLAACMVAAASALRQGMRGDVLLTAVPDEEHGSTGTEAAMAALAPVLAKSRADGAGMSAGMATQVSAEVPAKVPAEVAAEVPAEVAAIVTEPTDLSLHVAHRGFALFDVVLTGRASHTSKPEQGVNALTHLGRVLQEVETLDARLRQRPPHPLLGHGSWQAVLARGGEELFTTPAHAEVTLERRTLPGETAAMVAGEIDDLLTRAGAGDPSFRASVRPGVAREPFEADPSAAIVGLLKEAIEEVTGTPPDLLGAPYWTDAALVAAAADPVPTVLFGPVGGGIHRPDEWVDITSVRTMLRVLQRVIDRYCG